MPRITYTWPQRRETWIALIQANRHRLAKRLARGSWPGARTVDHTVNELATIETHAADREKKLRSRGQDKTANVIMRARHKILEAIETTQQEAIDHA